jgi:hypothetical protein
MTSTPTGRIASWLVCAGIIALGALACAAPSPKPDIPASPAVQGIPCAADPPIHFEMPDSPAKQGAWREGDFQDPVNRFDTPETVAAIQKHNAAVKAACGGK